MTTWYCWLEFDFGGVNFLVGEPGPGEQGVPCCLDDQDDYHTHDVDHNCFVADQDNYHEYGVDHNHDADQCSLDDQDDYYEHGVDHNHDMDQWIHTKTYIFVAKRL